MKPCFSSQLCCQDCAHLNQTLLIKKQLSPWNRHFSYSTWNLRSDTPSSHLPSKTLLLTPVKFSDEIFSGNGETKSTTSVRFGYRLHLDTDTNPVKVLCPSVPTLISSHISHRTKAAMIFLSFSNAPGTAHAFLQTFQNMDAAQESNDCTWGCFGMPSREMGDGGERGNHSEVSAQTVSPE